MTPPCATRAGLANATAPIIPVFVLVRQFAWGIDYLGGPDVDVQLSRLGLDRDQCDGFHRRELRAVLQQCRSQRAGGPPIRRRGGRGREVSREPPARHDDHQNNIDLATIQAGRVAGSWAISGRSGGIAVRRDVKVVAGMLRADNVCFRNSRGCGGIGSGGKIPGFFQASFFDHRKIPNELPAPYEVPGQLSGGRWQVTLRAPVLDRVPPGSQPTRCRPRRQASAVTINKC